MAELRQYAEKQAVVGRAPARTTSLSVTSTTTTTVATATMPPALAAPSAASTTRSLALNPAAPSTAATTTLAPSSAAFPGAQKEFDDMSIQQEASMGGVLRVTVRHMPWSLPDGVLLQVFGPYGCKKVFVLERTSCMVAYIFFHPNRDASEARRALHGRCIYDNCCWMDVQIMWGPSTCSGGVQGIKTASPGVPSFTPASPSTPATPSAVQHTPAAPSTSSTTMAPMRFSLRPPTPSFLGATKKIKKRAPRERRALFAADSRTWFRGCRPVDAVVASAVVSTCRGHYVKLLALSRGADARILQQRLRLGDHRQLPPLRLPRRTRHIARRPIRCSFHQVPFRLRVQGLGQLHQPLRHALRHGHHQPHQHRHRLPRLRVQHHHHAFRVGLPQGTPGLHSRRRCWTLNVRTASKQLHSGFTRGLQNAPVVAVVLSDLDSDIREVNKHGSHSSGKKNPPEGDENSVQNTVILPENYCYWNGSDSDGDNASDEKDFLDCKIDLVDGEELRTESHKAESKHVEQNGNFYSWLVSSENSTVHKVHKKFPCSISIMVTPNRNASPAFNVFKIAMPLCTWVFSGTFGMQMLVSYGDHVVFDRGKHIESLFWPIHQTDMHSVSYLKDVEGSNVSRLDLLPIPWPPDPCEMIVDNGVAAYSIFSLTECHCLSEAEEGVSQSLLVLTTLSPPIFSGIFQPFRNSQLSVWVIFMETVGWRVFDRGKCLDNAYSVISRESWTPSQENISASYIGAITG